ncbi:cytochrome P450 [Xylariaceae sp. FL0594]|nr:cytochrome P450 [Xylariaceae sp. FL0594]
MSLLALFARALLAAAIAWTVYSWTCLLLNYRSARKLGIPLRVLPISHGNPFWMLVDSRVVQLVRRLPSGDNSFTRYNWRGWEVGDRCRSHLEMGDVYMQVTPGKNWLYICNPDALLDMFRRRSDFPRPLEIYELLNIFGPNLSTVEGNDWKKQRKITAPCFNESTNEIVWSESLSLAADMLKYWSSQKSVKTTADDIRTLSLHVLSKAGFGKSFPFQGHDLALASTNPATSYKESLKVVLDNCVLIMALGTKFLSKPWLPRKLRRVHEACVAFQRHMTSVYEKEKRAFAEGRSAGRNLLSSLIRASNEEAEKAASLHTGTRSSSTFTSAYTPGHDTTAHTLMFAIAFLAANPHIQEWLAEELRQVFGDRVDKPQEWDYQGDFPRLKRCHAVLLETVRLYTPVPVAKWTEGATQRLRVGDDKVVTVPPDTMVIPSYAALHTHPRFWGPDALVWRPERWIEKYEEKDRVDTEELMTPRRGTFIPWSEGERSCPGKKFSQVEFVATIAALFNDGWRVSPERMRGESDERARERLSRLIETDSAQVLLLQMLHPERAPLVWTRR